MKTQKAKVVALKSKLRKGADEFARKQSESALKIEFALPVARNLKDGDFVGIWEWISVMEEGFGLNHDEVNTVFHRM